MRKINKRVAATILTFWAVFFTPPTLSDDFETQGHGLEQTGKYVATAGNCYSCHTVPGGEPYAGGVPFVTDFGTIYSTNITPDSEVGIGTWTKDEFRNAMRKGVRPNGEHLYPVFPYPSFSLLTETDLDALYTYFMSVPSARYVPPDNDLSFPYNQRWLLKFWNMLFLNANREIVDPSQSDEWNRGAYLVEALGHCGACHTPRNFLGAERQDMAHTGNTYLDSIPNGQLRPWSAVNLTSAPSGLAHWSVDDVESYLKLGVNSFATTFGPMNKVIMDSTRHLTDTDVRSMAVYLKSLPANEQEFAPVAATNELLAGERLYGLHCGTCHLPTGKGATDTGPALAGNPVVQAVDPASLINVILYGPELPNDPLPVVERQRHPPYENKLRVSEIAALASYLRSAWGNRGGRVSVEQVENQR